MRTCNPKMLISTLVILLMSTSIGFSQDKKTPKLDTLSIGLAPFMTPERFKPVAQLLTKELKMPLKYENFNSLVELAGNYQKYDLLYMNAFAFSYTQALDLPLNAFLARANAKEEALSYKSCLIIKADSPIESIAQVVEGAAELKLSFTYASSTSGHIVPRIYLTDQLGGSLENNFEEIKFLEDDVLHQVVSGSIDIGAYSCATLQEEVAKDNSLANEYRILWSSEAIPHAVMVTGSSIDAKMKKKLTKAFSKLKEYPSAWELLALTDMTQYTEVENSSFDHLTNKLKEDDELEFYLYYYESFSK